MKPADAYAVYVENEMMNRPFCTYEDALAWARKNVANGSPRPHHIRTLHAAPAVLPEQSRLRRALFAIESIARQCETSVVLPSIADIARLALSESEHAYVIQSPAPPSLTNIAQSAGSDSAAVAKNPPGEPQEHVGTDGQNIGRN